MRGTLRLTKASLKPNEPVAGTVELQIVESRGGMFAGRGGGGFRRRPPKPGAKKRGTQLRSAIALFKQLDANKNGVLDASEVAKSKSPLTKADKDRDGKVSLQELVVWTRESAKD